MRDVSGLHFSIIMLLVVTAGALIFQSGSFRTSLVEPISLLFNGSVGWGIVSECQKKRRRISSGNVKRPSSRRARYKSMFAPVATNQYSFDARGSTVLGKTWCELQVGKRVPVLIDNNSYSGRIMLFTQLWWPVLHVLTLVVMIFLARTRPQYTGLPGYAYLAVATLFLVYDYKIF